MSKDPAFLFYPSDFLTGTIFMSNEQVGAYIRLLCVQHQHGRLTDKQMQSVCKCYDADVYAKFEKDEDGLYYNDRLDKEARKRSAYVKSRRANASSRYEKKEDNEHMQSICRAYAEHMQGEECGGATDEEANRTESLDRMFEKFYAAYPRKEARSQAERAFSGLVMTDERFKAIMAAVESWKKTQRWTKNGGEYVPAPAKWLLEGRWEDELPNETNQNFVGTTHGAEYYSQFSDDPAEVLRRLAVGQEESQ